STGSSRRVLANAAPAAGNLSRAVAPVGSTTIRRDPRTLRTTPCPRLDTTDGPGPPLSGRRAACSGRRHSMTTRSWLRNLFASRTPRPPRQAPARFRPCLEGLEERLTPTTTIPVGPSTPELIAAINTADRTPGPVTLILPANTAYTLTQPDNPTTNASAGRE